MIFVINITDHKFSQEAKCGTNCINKLLFLCIYGFFKITFDKEQNGTKYTRFLVLYYLDFRVFDTVYQVLNISWSWIYFKLGKIL